MQKSDQQFKKHLLQSSKLNKTFQTLFFNQNASFVKIQSQLETTIQKFKKKFEECETNLEEIQIQWDKVKKFTNHGPGFLSAKSEEIKSKTSNIEAVTTGIKQTVSRIKPEKLAELPVDKHSSLQHIFKTIFFILYHKKQEDFNWESFKQLALKLQDGEDFISRLVNVHFRDLKNQEYEALMILKNDPEFDKVSTNSDFAKDIIDLADWVDYVCVGFKFSEQKKDAQKAYDKIRKDMHRRQGGSLQVSKHFWKQALEQVDKFQMNLVSLDSELKAFDVLTQNSLDDIKERTSKRTEQLKQFGEISA